MRSDAPAANPLGLRKGRVQRRTPQRRSMYGASICANWTDSLDVAWPSTDASLLIPRASQRPQPTCQVRGQQACVGIFSHRFHRSPASTPACTGRTPCSLAALGWRDRVAHVFLTAVAAPTSSLPPRYPERERQERHRAGLPPHDRITARVEPGCKAANFSVAVKQGHAPGQETWRRQFIAGV